MTNSEHETTISFDYADKIIRVYTTREGVKNGIEKRLGKEVEYSFERSGHGWSVEIPAEVCRSPEMICKLINPEQKTLMSEEQKQALRLAS